MSRKFNHNGMQLTAISIGGVSVMASGSGAALPEITQEIIRFEDSDGAALREVTLPAGQFKLLKTDEELGALYEQATPVED